MRNIRIDTRAAKDIDQHIDRVHRDMEYSGGKVELPVVRDLLRLDLQYYKADDPQFLDEVVHKLKIGAQQVIARPKLLLEAVRKFDLSALFIPDRKRILVDDSVPTLKKRWYESHEVGHSLIPWHAEYMHGDDRTTLSQACHQIIESEANYGAGRLLFPSAAFTVARRSSPITLAQVRALASYFGNTITSTLWRCVEQSEGISFATIGEHPHHAREEKPQIEYFVCSGTFERQFENVRETDIWEWMKTYCKYTRTGPIGSSEIVVSDVTGKEHVFSIESFSNKHSVLTLGCWAGQKNVQVHVSNFPG